jgi:hypothetical protein
MWVVTVRVTSCDQCVSVYEWTDALEASWLDTLGPKNRIEKSLKLVNWFEQAEPSEVF